MWTIQALCAYVKAAEAKKNKETIEEWLRNLCELESSEKKKQNSQIMRSEAGW